MDWHHDNNESDSENPAGFIGKTGHIIWIVFWMVIIGVMIFGMLSTLYEIPIFRLLINGGLFIGLFLLIGGIWAAIQEVFKERGQKEAISLGLTYKAEVWGMGLVGDYNGAEKDPKLLLAGLKRLLNKSKSSGYGQIDLVELKRTNGNFFQNQQYIQDKQIIAHGSLEEIITGLEKYVSTNERS
jgi:hypothetical protein